MAPDSQTRARFDPETARLAAEWHSFVDEIKSDSDRGVVLAVASKVEAAAIQLLKAALGSAAENYRSLDRAIKELLRFGLVSKATHDLIDELKQLRNAAAHSPRPFSLFMPPHEARAGRLASSMEKHIRRVRIDDAWAEHDEKGQRGDFVIAARLIWETLERAASNVKPLVDSSRPPLDVESTDPEEFCVISKEELAERAEEQQRMWGEYRQEQIDDQVGSDPGDDEE